MKLKPVVVALSLMAGVSAASAETVNLGPYSLTYNETTSFGYVAGSFSASGDVYGFSWNFSPTVNVASSGSTIIATFDLPSFTITAEPGYALSDFTAFLGNLQYTEINFATTNIQVLGEIAVNGGPATSVNHLVGWTETASDLTIPYRSGYFAESATLPGSFFSLDVSNASLVLSASGGAFSNIAANPQNKIEFSFTAVPVPEPETYAMLLAGLGVMGAIARRRRTIKQ